MNYWYIDHDKIYKKSPKNTNLDKIEVVLEEDRPIITDIDVQNGYIIRYFICRLSDPQLEIYEVNKHVYDNLKSIPLFLSIDINWKIKDESNDNKIRLQSIIKSNKYTVDQASKIMKGLSIKLKNYLEYIQS